MEFDQETQLTKVSHQRHYLCSFLIVRHFLLQVTRSGVYNIRL
jgi:hypothetical protein